MLKPLSRITEDPVRQNHSQMHNEVHYCGIRIDRSYLLSTSFCDWLQAARTRTCPAADHHFCTNFTSSRSPYIEPCSWCHRLPSMPHSTRCHAHRKSKQRHIHANAEGHRELPLTTKKPAQSSSHIIHLFTTTHWAIAKTQKQIRSVPWPGTMTMTMTHSEKSHINQMRAWPYRQECRDHGPSKKNLFYWGSLLFGKVCKNKLLWTECNATRPWPGRVEG